MEKKTLEILAGLALIIMLSGPTSVYALGYFDSDGDGVIDNQDPFPNDPLKSKDSDGDGVGDNADAFPYDPNEQYDSDGDGVGDNEDKFPNNPKDSKDSDGDGAGDNTDAFPFDPAAHKDSDHDGYPDEWNKGWNQSNGITNLILDVFPNNPEEYIDTDSDGVGDNGDKFPSDPAASLDSDDDGYPNRWNDGMNQSNSTTNLTIDAFPYDPNEQYDSDGDNVGDNTDVFPNNPNIWRDPSTLPSEVVFDRNIQLSKITVGRGITFDDTYYYILNHDEEESKRKVYQFNSNFTFTGLTWDYTDHIEYPKGIVYYDNHIYIIGNKYEGEHGGQAYIFKFSKTGEHKKTTSISSNVHYVEAITSADNHLYICDSEPTRIHIYNANTLSHVGSIYISHFPSDIIVHETGDWYYLNDQSNDVKRLYLYDLDGSYQNWNIQFDGQKIELVGDTLIALSGNNIYIYKLF